MEKKEATPETPPIVNVTSPTSIEWQERDGGVMNVYANFVSVNWTDFDVRMRFAQMMQRINPENPDPQSGHKAVVEERVAVTMSWTEAKFIAGLLTQLIGRYESINGEIKNPQLPT